MPGLFSCALSENDYHSGMQVSQNDLWLLTHLRAAWSGDDAIKARSAAALCEFPGRAQGRVAAWAFGKFAAVLGRGARRTLSIGEELVPSADERRILSVFHAMAADGEVAAADAARWLVRGDHTDALIRSIAPLMPLAEDQGILAPRRVKTKAA